MPTFQGLVSEEQLMQLIAYVKSLGAPPPGGGAATSTSAPAPAANAPAAR
jgi:cytochrome c oxidase subunit 2